jgi:hypothetical protein
MQENAQNNWREENYIENDILLDIGDGVSINAFIFRICLMGIRINFKVQTQIFFKNIQYIYIVI